MKKSNIAGLVILVVVFAALAVWNFISGIKGLSNNDYAEATISTPAGKICEVEVDYAVEVYTVSHTLNILIPTGKEHFYWCASGSGDGEGIEGVELLVKARQSWYDANFTKSGLARKTVTVKGEVMKMDSKFSKDMGDINRELLTAGAKISTQNYLSTTYKTQYTLKFASGLFTIAAAAVSIVLFKLGKGGKFAVILLILAVVFAGFVLLFGETL